jgi:hypothetical protein
MPNNTKKQSHLQIEALAALYACLTLKKCVKYNSKKSTGRAVAASHTLVSSMPTQDIFFNAGIALISPVFG